MLILARDTEKSHCQQEATDPGALQGWQDEKWYFVAQCLGKSALENLVGKEKGHGHLFSSCMPAAILRTKAFILNTLY